MIEIFTIIFSVLLILTQTYIIYNLYTKVDRLEQWVDSTYMSIQAAIVEMKKIDSTGHFEADDEVGTVFTQLKETVFKLEQITEE